MNQVSPKRKEAGQTLVIIAVAMVGLVAMLALAIDGGNMYLERRRAQNAADAAALAAARRLAEDWNDAALFDTITEYAVTRNGADSVEGVYLPSEEAIGGGYVPPDSDAVRIRVTKTISPIFAGAIGMREITVSAETAAQYEILSGGCGGYAIWAQSQTCSRPIDWTGSGGLIVGHGHSNGKVKVSGSGHVVNGTMEYVTTVQETGSGHQITYVQTAASDSYPVEWNMDDYRPGGRAALAAQAEGKYFVHNCSTWHVSGSGKTIPEGLHYCTGKVRISGSAISGHVTIVAEGTIDVSGSGHSYEYYCDGLLFFSNYERNGTPKCTNPVIDVSGSGGTWEGVIYAPNGVIEYTGSGQQITYGSLIGWGIDISGSGFTLTYDDDICENMAQRIVVHIIQ